ncbi:BON domain-containing protein [Phenylobacterium sp. VNQ135]|uniref:BON domain-containing protein n=1 Tax=Phenylobacterium sp. VNQ135 TaxID=3400922 RepID=UPI003C07F5A0
MSEWNRNDRNDMRRFEREDPDRDRSERDRGYGGGREQRSFYGSDGSSRQDSGQGYGGQGYGYGGRQNQGASGYAQSGQGYGGQAYGQGYGGAGHPGQSYGSGESYGQSGEEFGRQPYGGRSFGGHDYAAGQSGGHHRDWGESDRRSQGYGQGGQGGSMYGQSGSGQSGAGQSSYGQGGAQQFGDPNQEVRRVADGDTGAGHGMARMFGGGMAGGQHRGKGPKNYTRSDDRIREDVNDRLADDDWLDASDIDVTVDKCEVTLTGTVTSREDKRRAEDVAERVSGVKHVQNNIRVQAQDSTTSSYSMQGTSPAGGPSENGLAGQNSVSGTTTGSTGASSGSSTGGSTSGKAN